MPLPGTSSPILPIRASDPERKILFMTGYDDLSGTDDPFANEIVIKKPAYHGRNPFPPRAFSHGPFPTGGRQRLLSRQGRFATEIRPAADFMIIVPGTAADLLRAPVES